MATHTSDTLRPAITFDILFRYLKHIGYKVRYVRNITDVGHLEHDADEGDDKIEKKARLEQLEPMEIAQHYTNRYHDAMRLLNVLPPSIEPHATGHIIEQEELVKQILTNGYAYESNGSIYFDVEKYDKDHHYGVLSGRNIIDMINNSRELAGVGEKHNQIALLFGNVLCQSISCVGRLPGAMVSLVGTASVQRWDASIWAITSIFMVVEWTLSSLTTSARLHKQLPHKATKW